MRSQIEGALFEHRIISDDCRRGKPTNMIIFEVNHSVEEALRNLLNGWPKGSGVKVHVAVTLERPPEDQGENHA